MKQKAVYAIIIILLFFLALNDADRAFAQKSPYDWALIHLDYARKEKAQQLRRFTKRLHQVAQNAAKDERLISFYELNRHYHDALNQGKSIPPALGKDIKTIRRNFDRYYLSEYYSFYDILFLNNDGVVFYTIRKEMDLHANLLKDRTRIGPLAEVIASRPDREVFIDFYFYNPSSEPAAFFVEPVFNGGVQVGWIALQCAINKLNSIFTSTADLGQTGETFLVNTQGLMLTESYFKGSSTILKQHLDDKNIKPKFNDRVGHRRVIDYRGETVLSSFEVFEFLSSKWLIVAKIDKDEVTTGYYRDHKHYFQEFVVNYLKEKPAPETDRFQPAVKGQAYRVDMDEFLKADNCQILETWGISTCTAVLAKVAGKFAYLGHLSSKDKMYNGSETNLLGQITRKIQSFDLYPYEFKTVEFVVVAPHLDTITNITDHLLESGFFLSQIKIAYHPSAKSAALVYDYKKDVLQIKWRIETGNNQAVDVYTNSTDNLMDLVEKGIDLSNE